MLESLPMEHMEGLKFVSKLPRERNVLRKPNHWKREVTLYKRLNCMNQSHLVVAKTKEDCTVIHPCEHFSAHGIYNTILSEAA